MKSTQLMPALGSGSISGLGVLVGKPSRVKPQKRGHTQLAPNLGPPNTILENLPRSSVQRVGQTAGKNPRQRVRVQLQGQNKQERAKKRQVFAQGQMDLSRFKGQSFLAVQAVSQVVALDYKIRLHKFHQFARQKKLSLRGFKNIDKAFEEFLNELFFTGTDLGDATKYLAALVDSEPGCSDKMSLPRSRRCLQGWHKLDPGQTRAPIPWELIALMVVSMWENNMLTSALLVLLMYDAYLRPGEALGVTIKDLVYPTANMPHHCINLHPSAEAQSSKMGLSDETIVLDGVTLPWMGQVLAKHKMSAKGLLLFDTEYRHFKADWDLTLQNIGLPSSHAVPHQLRHSGPSVDMLKRCRTLMEIKAKRLFSQALRRACQTESGVSTSAEESSKLGSGSPKTTGDFGPKIFMPPEEIDKKVWILEVFSGSAHLSRALAKAGFRVAAWDVSYNVGCDVLEEAVLSHLLRFCVDKRVVLVWFGMPCQSWSRARRWDGGPPPLRDDALQLYGRARLSSKDSQKVFTGNLLLFWTYLFCNFLNLQSIPWVVENPFTSRCWLTSVFQTLIAGGAILHRVDFCQYHTPWRKSTGLLSSNLVGLDKMLRICDTIHGRCSATQRRHVILSGQDAQGTWWTVRAQPYPKPLCRDLASFFTRAHSVGG